MDLTIQYHKHYAANRFRRTGTTGSRRYGAAREWRKSRLRANSPIRRGMRATYSRSDSKESSSKRELFLGSLSLRGEEINGQDLATKHGGPRLLVPHLYFMEEHQVGAGPYVDAQGQTRILGKPRLA